MISNSEGLRDSKNHMKEIGKTIDHSNIIREIVMKVEGVQEIEKDLIVGEENMMIGSIRRRNIKEAVVLQEVVVTVKIRKEGEEEVAVVIVEEDIQEGHIQERKVKGLKRNKIY